MSLSRSVLLVVVAVGIAAGPAASRAGEGAGSPDSSLATSGGPDSDLATSNDPDATATSHDSDRTRAHSGDSDADLSHADAPDSTGQSESPDAALAPDVPATSPDAVPAGALALAPPPSCAAPQSDGDWSSCLRDASAQIEVEREALARADAAYSQSITNRVHLGSERAKIIEERTIANVRLAKAQQQLPELVERARVAGVSRAVLDPYEN